MSIISLFLLLFRQPCINLCDGGAGRIKRRMMLLHIFGQQEGMARIRDKIQLRFYAAGVQQIVKFYGMEGEHHVILLAVKQQGRAGLRRNVLCG